MPIKGSKALNLKNKHIGTYQKNKKTLSEMETKINEQNFQIEQKRKLIESQNNELKILEMQLGNLSTEYIKKNKILNFRKMQLKKKTLGISEDSTKTLTISNKVTLKRRLKPSGPELPVKAKYVRGNETFDFCAAIHGGTKLNKEPVLDGALDMISRKFTNTKVASKIVSTKSAIASHIEGNAIVQWNKLFYKSTENILRSMNTYYSHNVMGKAKYLSIRKANRNATYQKTKIVNFISYLDLSQEINKVDYWCSQ